MLEAAAAATAAAEGGGGSVGSAAPVAAAAAAAAARATAAETPSFALDGHVSQPSVESLARSGPVSLCLIISLGGGLESATWECVFEGGNLYLELPAALPDRGSREAFVALLEYAEETLQANYVVVCFQRSRSDRPALVKLFLFFGFAPLPPGHSLIARLAPSDMLFMAYDVNQ